MEKRYYEDSIKNVAEEIRREYGCEQVVIVNYEYLEETKYKMLENKPN